MKRCYKIKTFYEFNPEHIRGKSNRILPLRPSIFIITYEKIIISSFIRTSLFLVKLSADPHYNVVQPFELTDEFIDNLIKGKRNVKFFAQET